MLLLRLLVIIDYWGAPSPMNERYRSMAIGKNDIRFLGAVNRLQMLQELVKSDIFFYP